MNGRSVRGFTLIELLVVIAIIGILSAVVLAALSTARNKGSYAAIQSDLSSVQTEAEIYYSGAGGNSYGGGDALGTCGVAGTMYILDTTIKSAIAAADSANGSGNVYCGTNGTKSGYAVAVQLVSDNTKYWCVDSSGNAKQEPSASMGAAVYTCP